MLLTRERSSVLMLMSQEFFPTAHGNSGINIKIESFLCRHYSVCLQGKFGIHGIKPPVTPQHRPFCKSPGVHLNSWMQVAFGAGFVLCCSLNPAECGWCFLPWPGILCLAGFVWKSQKFYLLLLWCFITSAIQWFSMIKKNKTKNNKKLNSCMAVSQSLMKLSCLSWFGANFGKKIWEENKHHRVTLGQL